MRKENSTFVLSILLTLSCKIQWEFLLRKKIVIFSNGNIKKRQSHMVGYGRHRSEWVLVKHNKEIDADKN